MITIQNLTKKYGGSVIFENADYQFPSKGLVCLLGASGSGKSTLLNLLAGFDSDYAGDILVGNHSLSQMNAEELCAYRRDNIGFVFQNYCLLPGYTVKENIMLPCSLHPQNETAEETVSALLSRVGMDDKANKKIENLSGGQKQRTAIARALAENPSIILADEPTGALDRKNSSEIMSLLKETAQSRLVIVITHDPKICDFADEVIHIKEHKIVTERQKNTENENVELSQKTSIKPSPLKLGIKNFRIHLKRYIVVALAVSVGVLAFLFSLSYGNIMAKNIDDFKAKNTAFGNGYIKVEKEMPKLFSRLSDDERIENVYYQYVIQNVSLSVDGNTENMTEKYPMPKATEKMSYGVMPRFGQNEIALSPSLAKKFDSQINNLIGKDLILAYGQEEYRLIISGIFNAGYDDFFVSADIEQTLYEKADRTTPYALNYDVKAFEDVVSVTQLVKEQGVQPQTAANEVETMQNTFYNIQNMFWIVSVLVLVIAVFISAVLLVKMQNTRYHELGLLSALGFHKSTIRNMIVSENLLLSGFAILCNAVFVVLARVTSGLLGIEFAIGIFELILSMLGTGIIVMLISILAVMKPLHTEPAKALRK